MVRTKLTGKARSKPNGAPKAPPTATKTSPDTEKSPKPTAQPVELSEKDKNKFKNWLDAQEKPFGIITAPASLKRKRDTGMSLQSDLWEDRLSINYDVKPRDKWDCLRRYKKFTVGVESIAIGQCILVKHDDDYAEGARIDLAAQWKAKVLEVRALDSEHVYIRVAWLNRPEDLDKGRKPYHGKNELIPTNQMDVIDAMAVNGSLEIVHWDEADDEAALMKEDEFFWRQTFDYANSRTFSKLREICVDKAPQNPDEMILQCGRESCRKWLHVKCIAEAAVQNAADDAPAAKKVATTQARSNVKINAKSAAAAKAETDSFTAELSLRGLPNGEGQTPAEKTEIVVIDPKGERHPQAVACLFCGSEIE